MDQAIYESTTQKIFGVRGQWLFKFNSVTGALEDSLRFMSNVGAVSTITAFGGKLYIGASWTPVVNYGASPSFPDEDIYIVNAAAFTVIGRLNLGAKITTYGGASVAPGPVGWSCLVNDGTTLLGQLMGTNIFRVDPTNTPGYTSTAQKGTTDTAYDATNGVLWLASSFNPDIWCYNPVFASFQSCSDTNGNLNTICGICYNSALNRVYAVDGTSNFYNFNATLAVPGFTNFAVNTLTTGRINCNAFRVKSVNNLVGNPYNGKVLIAGWADDSVIIITPNVNPLLDSVTVNTGFTAPIDIVSTPTKNFAVQSGTTGLKEIV